MSTLVGQYVPLELFVGKIFLGQLSCKIQAFLGQQIFLPNLEGDVIDGVFFSDFRHVNAFWRYSVTHLSINHAWQRVTSRSQSSK